jgi:hypothetical protein
MQFGARAAVNYARLSLALHLSTPLRRTDHILYCAPCNKLEMFALQQGETSRDIATRKDLNEILQILNSPASAQPSGSPEKIIRSSTKKTRDKGKKREKIESGTSSKDSASRPKDRKKVGFLYPKI